MSRTEENDEVMRAVKALKDATKNLSKDSNNVESLLEVLKNLQKEELKEYQEHVKDPKLKRKLVSLYNLVSHLEPQVKQARKLASRKGIKYYLSRAKGKVLGKDFDDVAHLMESELQSWLDLQNVEQIVQVLQDETSGEEEKIEALQRLQARVQKGYSLELQDVILSTKAFDSVSSLLSKQSNASNKVKKVAAFTISDLVTFNKDVFLSQVIIQGVVEGLLDMVDCEDDEICVGVVAVLSNLIVAGKAAVVDEIHAKGGIPRIVGLLEVDCAEVRIVATDCIFEMAFFGRMSAVEAMLQAQVIKKLAALQLSEAGGQVADLPMGSSHSVDSSMLSNSAVLADLSDSDDAPSRGESTASEIVIQAETSEGEHYDIPIKSLNLRKRSSFSSDEASQVNSDSPRSTDENHQKVKEYWRKHPFADAVTRFTMQLAMGQGLRQREKRALKMEIVKHIKEAIPSDAQAATILAEVLWGL